MLFLFYFCVFFKYFYNKHLLWVECVVVQLLSHDRLFVTPWSAAHQAPLSFTVSQSLLKFMSIEWGGMWENTWGEEQRKIKAKEKT